MIKYVVATGTDALEWSRHKVYSSAKREAQKQLRQGSKIVTIWRVEDFDASSGEPVLTLC